MIEIRPLHTSVLSGRANVKLPGSIHPTRPRGIETNIALDGTAIVTAWGKNNTGGQSSVNVIINDTHFSLLKAMVDTDRTQIVSSMGEMWECVVDYTNVERVFKNKQPMVKCVVTFVIISEVSSD